MFFNMWLFSMSAAMCRNSDFLYSVSIGTLFSHSLSCNLFMQLTNVLSIYQLASSSVSVG